MPGLIVSLRTQLSHFDDEINARQVIFRANTAQIATSSTLTIPNSTPSNEGTYDVAVMNPAGAIVSGQGVRSRPTSTWLRPNTS